MLPRISTLFSRYNIGLWRTFYLSRRKEDLIQFMHIKKKAITTILEGHFMNKQRDINDHRPLEEVCRTTSLWRTSWDQYSDGGKYGNAFMTKLHQIETEGFG